MEGIKKGARDQGIRPNCKIINCEGSLCWENCVLMEGGATRNRRAMPPIEKPMSCVDITSIQLSDTHQCSHSREELVSKRLTKKAPCLFVVNTLYGDNICRVGALCAHTCHDCYQNLITRHVRKIPTLQRRTRRGVMEEMNSHVPW